MYTFGNMYDMTTFEPATIQRVTKPPMRQRTYKSPDDLHDKVMARCEERDHNISDIIRTALKMYVRGELEPED